MKDYSKAFVEVLEILKYIPEEEYQRIPEDKIKFFKENMDKEYEFSIDPNVELSKQNISREANAIIVTLFRDYFASENQKEKLNHILQVNEEKSEEERINAKQTEEEQESIAKQQLDVKEEQKRYGCFFEYEILS